MRNGGGKAKGCAYERSVCKRLSLWVSNFEREDAFWRSAMSGGRATRFIKKHVKKKKSSSDISAHAGDVTCTHSCGEILTETFLIECKNYKDFEMGRVAMGRKGKLRDFWLTLLPPAKYHKKLPLLIGKQNFYEEIAVTNREGYKLLSVMGKLPKLATFKDGMVMFTLRDLLALPFEKFRKFKTKPRIKRVRLNEHAARRHT